MEFKLRSNARYFTDEELLDDLKKVAKLLNKNRVTQVEYQEFGQFSRSTFQNRFGSWNKALITAQLDTSLEQNIAEIELFDNLETMWKTLERQPKYSEMVKPLSKYSIKPYESRFDSWLNACSAFIEYKENDIKFTKSRQVKPKKTRYINEKIRLKILKRDNYSVSSVEEVLLLTLI